MQHTCMHLFHTDKLVISFLLKDLEFHFSQEHNIFGYERTHHYAQKVPLVVTLNSLCLYLITRCCYILKKMEIIQRTMLPDCLSSRVSVVCKTFKGKYFN